MKEPKYHLALENYERTIIINSLNAKRNELILDGKYADAVGDLIIAFVNAKKRKFKITDKTNY